MSNARNNDNTNLLQSQAAHIVEERVKQKSRRGYKGKLNSMKGYFLETPTRMQYLEGGNNDIIVPLPRNIIEDLFGWLSRNTDLPRMRGGNNNNNGNDIESDAEIPDLLIDEEEVDEEEGGYGNDVGIGGDEVTDDVFNDTKITVSASCMSGYKSALLWYYGQKKIYMDPEVDKWLNDFVQGYKKTIANKKVKGIMDINEGKSPFSFNGYKFLAHVFMTLTPQGNKYPFKESIFCWLFFLLLWNLIGRTSNVKNINLKHIDWGVDCLKIIYAQSKGDQTGEALGNEKHVYANPENPNICVILALGVYIFCRKRGTAPAEQELHNNNNNNNNNNIGSGGSNRGRGRGSNRGGRRNGRGGRFGRGGGRETLFLRRRHNNISLNKNNFLFTNDNIDKFGKCLTTIVQDNNKVPNNVDLGAAKEKLGTHSCRKGLFLL